MNPLEILPPLLPAFPTEGQAGNLFHDEGSGCCRPQIPGRQWGGEGRASGRQTGRVAAGRRRLGQKNPAALNRSRSRMCFNAGGLQ